MFGRHMTKEAQRNDFTKAQPRADLDQKRTGQPEKIAHFNDVANFNDASSIDGKEVEEESEEEKEQNIDSMSKEALLSLCREQIQISKTLKCQLKQSKNRNECQSA